jgi:hypothetical protein
MKQRVWVICGNSSEYHNYVRSKPLNEDKKYHYVGDVYTLRGYSNPHGVFVGSWKHRHDIIDIIDQLIISSTDNSDNLIKIKRDLIKNATASTAYNIGVSRAAQALSDAIDDEVLKIALQQVPVSSGVFSGMDYQHILSYLKT